MASRPAVKYKTITWLAETYIAFTTIIKTFTGMVSTFMAFQMWPKTFYSLKVKSIINMINIMIIMGNNIISVDTRAGLT